MNFFAVAFVSDEGDLFLTTVKAKDFDNALFLAITEYGLFVPTPEKYEVDYYNDQTNYIEFCKIACNIIQVEFKTIRVQVII